MIQRFFLDRIDTKPAAPPIGGEHHPIPHPLPDETKSALTFVQFAKSRAKPALDSPIRQSRPPTTGIIRLLQLCHHCAISFRKSDLARCGDDEEHRLTTI